MNLSARKTTGFTLVELMVVVGVMAVVAMVAVPQYVKILETAKTQLCVAQQKVLFESGSLYELDENVSLKEAGGQKARLEELVDKGYIRSAEGFECPSSPVEDYDDYRMIFDGAALTDIECTIKSEEHEWP
ncbi:MAG: prepilin-type N-terminal cleavage/methylation domain-containing protein [Candidatus Omnitrophica bacterium]|nr:prepilin-type N-terminal cleavage/methylation domain-containing protein [Candidatus Omnitrophota bacterium]